MSAILAVNIPKDVANTVLAAIQNISQATRDANSNKWQSPQASCSRFNPTTKEPGRFTLSQRSAVS